MNTLLTLSCFLVLATAVSADSGDNARLESLDHQSTVFGNRESTFRFSIVSPNAFEGRLDWRVEIDDGIRNAAAVIAVMTPEARSSEYVTYEWAFAWGREIRVIPIMLRQTTMHPRLAALQYLDFTNRIARPWTRLVEVLNGREEGGGTK